ncbi:MAG: 3-deoxy-8-phosphooctulonate synthase [Pseudomonadota bacterium]|jgi:2-dehydro-3-deoxyphosphooctonate aldolase (KDO 8-P synthase)|nr:3-deoxy-8-phosphooctulonate synthase [Pseudomonadota bacterium]NLX31398.1 3-deoxy-8-phosphooctulonate synthase [Deltaproteobacteria bacterium]HNZ35687.1 3-deoxy-8-phosphooctulonate synthase [Syntrophales bacterium]HPV54325.1 3-deoxy-8-phosphooctulonate synthase [Syntrophales bacterium]HPX02858.1 3-deoxy-8-phosphooctulonate synthase [Syntrophales bacterium]
MRKVNVGGIRVGGGEPFALIAGPCVIEGEKLTRRVAASLRDVTAELGIPFIFKSSYDKANRTSVRSFRGPGLDKGLKILKAIREELGVPVLSDVHRFEEIERAAEVLDVAQVPAFLCRQTDFVMELARNAKVVNIKKGQFLAPWDMANVVRKVEAAGNRNILITERGASFGYNNLVSDMRSIPILRGIGYPVVFDATHSVQLPGGAGEASGGERAMAVYLARAAAAVGVDALFLEVHPEPDRARCDGPNSLALDSLRDLLRMLQGIDGIVKEDMKKGRR